MWVDNRQQIPLKNMNHPKQPGMIHDLRLRTSDLRLNHPHRSEITSFLHPYDVRSGCQVLNRQ